MINFIAEKISSRYRKALEKDIERQLEEDNRQENFGKILKATTVGVGTECPQFTLSVSGSTSTERWSSGNLIFTGGTYSSNDNWWLLNDKNDHRWWGVSGVSGTSGPSGVSGVCGTSGPSGKAGTSAYIDYSKPIIDYSDYIAEHVDNTIKYTEYIAQNLEKSINYSEYIAEQIGGSKYGEWMTEYANVHKPKKEIKRVYSPEDPYGEEDWSV